MTTVSRRLGQAMDQPGPRRRPCRFQFIAATYYDLIAATLRRRKEGIREKKSSRGSVFTRVQCCPLAIDGGDTDADGETVHAADTPSSTAAFCGARQRAGDRRVGRRRTKHGAGLSGPGGC